MNYFNQWGIPTNYEKIEHPWSKLEKEQGLKLTEENIRKMSLLQEKLYAHDKWGILIILQGCDTCGKDGIIKNVMTGLNPQATQVFSFKEPSKEELDHDYMWRYSKCLPERGDIGIFNRSYYEEVLVVKVHNLLESQKLPVITENIWEQRYNQINNFETYLNQNGIIPIKFFLNISKDEQKKRLLSRIEDKSKNWKFADSDIKEREFWNEYQQCYKKIFKETNTDYAPWFNVPSDRKWFARFLVSDVIVKKLEGLKLTFPKGANTTEVLEGYKKKLLS